MKHIHDLGFIHLDLKPANVLITFEGVLKIADFGMATRWPAKAGIEGEGDREYIGPEILMGRYDKPADVFALGDYQPLEVSGPHRDHIIAFARRRGKSAVIVAAGRWFAPFTQGGRSWPKAEAFDATINVTGFAVEGDADSGTEIRVSSLFQALPAAVLKANVLGAARPARRKITTA